MPDRLPPEMAAVLKKPFAEQAAFFRQKLGNLVPTQKWDDILGEAHDRAFMVAGAAKANLLADLAAAVDKAIADGETLDTFKARFLDIVRRRGWAGWTGDDRSSDQPKGGKGVAWRTRVIYETNLITSYSAGRLAQLKDGGYQWWVYRHSDFVRNPRPHHVALDGTVKRADDPFWKTYYPPNGWGCRCRVVGARSERMARRLGGDPDKRLPEWVGEIDPETGAPAGVDRGWAYQPGGTSDLVREIERKAERLPQPLAEALRDDVSVYRGSLRKAIDDVLQRAKADAPKVEYAALLDAGGALRWVKRGGESFVSFTDDELRQMAGATLVHNHPSGGSLSIADLRLAAFNGLRRIFAIANDRSAIYAATPLVDDAALASAYDRANGEVFGKLLPKVNAGVISVAEAELFHHHAVNTLMAKRGAIRYRRVGKDVPSVIKEVINELLHRGP